MITIFSLPKAFEGHIGLIQENAIGSWLATNPDCEIILFGNDPGVAEAADRFKVRHHPTIERNEFGTPLVSHLFEQAQNMAQGSVLCYVNADIIFLKRLDDLIDRAGRFNNYLIVGKRWNLDVSSKILFSSSSWQPYLMDQVKELGELFTESGIDYFIFRKGFYDSIPAFAIGRSSWDNWLIYKAREKRIPVIDATENFTVIHQNHDYHPSLMSKSKPGPWKGAEARENLKLAGDLDYCFTIEDAEWNLTPNGLEKKEKPPLKIPHELTVRMVLFRNHKFFGWFFDFILRLRLWLRRGFRALRTARQT